MVDAGHSPEEAQALIQPYLANAETMAPLFGQTPKEYLESRLAGAKAMTPEEFAGLGAKEGEQHFHAAMYRSKAENVQEFVDLIPITGNPGTEFFHLRPVKERPVELPASQVQHIKQRHPDFSEWERIPDVIEIGQVNPVGFSDYAQSQAYAYVLNEGNTSLIVLAADVPGNLRRRRPSRHVVLTAFRDNSQKVSNWLERFANKNAASPSGKNQIPPGARQIERPASLEPQSGESNITTLDAEVKALRQGNGNTLYKPAPPTDAPAFKSWFGDSKVVDDAGKPLTLWHQTGADIEAFDPRKPGAGGISTAKFCVARSPQN